MVLNERSRRRRGRGRLLDPPTIPWANSDRSQPKVLLECPPDKSPSIIAEILEREGFAVVTCEGPAEHARCPVVEGEYCSALQGVDVVVNLFGDRPGASEVLGALVDSGPRPPAIVGELAPGVDARPEIRWISSNSRRTELTAAIQQALGGE